MMSDLPPTGSRSLLPVVVHKAGWAEGLHPRAAGGRFAQSQTATQARARRRRRRRKIRGHERTAARTPSLQDPNRTTIISNDPSFAAILQRWVREAVMAGIPVPDGVIEFRTDQYLSDAAVTIPPNGPTYMALTQTLAAGSNPRDGWTQVRDAFFLELGHHLDYRMPDWARAQFLTITNQRGRPWRSPPNSPHEQFAEAYRAIVIAATGGPRVAQLAFTLDLHGNRFSRVRQLIQRISQAQIAPRL